MHGSVGVLLVERKLPALLFWAQRCGALTGDEAVVSSLDTTSLLLQPVTSLV